MLWHYSLSATSLGRTHNSFGVFVLTTVLRATGQLVFRRRWLTAIVCKHLYICLGPHLLTPVETLDCLNMSLAL